MMQRSSWLGKSVVVQSMVQCNISVNFVYHKLYKSKRSVKIDFARAKRSFGLLIIIAKMTLRTTYEKLMLYLHSMANGTARYY